MAYAHGEFIWTLTRTDTSAVHPFMYNPTVLPSFDYERPMTEHRLLNGSVKYDVENYKVKTLTLRWADNVFLPRSEREALEDLLTVNATFILTWEDHEEDHEEDPHRIRHVDTGYLSASHSSPVYKVGYT
ncbi:unnamed protein product [marine sediment metagenome]|uniref:Uncharacterized protein n=1 Tax=marine sediment metagenome TaxID=412755 RepID=X1IIE1_9ZZZZ